MATLTGTLTGALRSPARALRRPMSIEGVWGWITTVDAKRVGILYGVTALVFMISGGAEAMIIRIQLARADASIVSPDTFNQLFTMHGTVMIFLVIMPLNAAFTNFIMPLMIGARDVAFPRLNALSYWIFLAAGLFIHLSFVTGGAPDRRVVLLRKSDRRCLLRDPRDRLLDSRSSHAGYRVGPLCPELYRYRRQHAGAGNELHAFAHVCLDGHHRVLPDHSGVSDHNGCPDPSSLDRIAGTSFFVTSGGGDPVLWQHCSGSSAIRRSTF